MSAFIVSSLHIDYLVAAFVKYRLCLTSPASIGQALLDANIDSIINRYGNEEVGSKERRYEFDANKIDRMIIDIDPMQTLKAIKCLEYQCNYLDDQEKAVSVALSMLAALKDRCISDLPGYDNLMWHIDEQI